MSEPYWIPLSAMPVDYEGEWAAGTPYVPGDVVRRNGIDYLAVNPSTGQTPPSAVRSSAELAYAELATDLTLAVAGTDILTLPPLAFDGATAIIVDFSAPQFIPNGTWAMWVSLFDGSTDLGRLGTVRALPSGAYVSFYGRRRLVPAAGSHTFKVRGQSETTAGQIAGTGNVPALLRARLA